MQEHVVDFVLQNYKIKPIKELARDLNVTPQEIAKVFRAYQLVSPFLCSKFEINHTYSDISYTCFRIVVEDILSFGLTNPNDIFILAILEYCFDTSHDIKEAKKFFQKYYYEILVPQLDDLQDVEFVISDDLISLITRSIERKNKNGKQ